MTKKPTVDTQSIYALVQKGMYDECNCWRIRIVQDDVRIDTIHHVWTRTGARLRSRLWVTLYRRRLVKEQPFMIR